MWTIKNRFLFTFVLFSTMLVVVMALLSGFYLHDSFSRIADAPAPSLIPVMADRMYNRFLFGFTTAVIGTILISIPVGISLFGAISKRYLTFLSEIRSLGESRLAMEGKEEVQNELETLEQYRSILQDDLQKIQDFEKVKGWQTGARMLIHELKNPMTPLKLNAQKLMLKGAEGVELTRILKATDDMEMILRAFRDLVNIDFPPKITLQLHSTLADFFSEFSERYPQLEISHHYSGSGTPVLSEPSLLKMVLINLINNGVEANNEKLYVEVKESKESITIDVVTPDRELENPSQIFRLGYSEKGEGRGFGLFLCREISNYLNLNLTASNETTGVQFRLTVQKSEIK